MAFSKCSACPMTKYYHYLDSPTVYSKYYLNDPYWTRYHHEYERMRVSLMSQQNMIEEMTSQVRAARTERSDRIDSCVDKCASIAHNLKMDSRAISTIESEISGWQRAVSEMHTTLNSLRSKTQSMDSSIASLRNDMSNCSLTLKTEFDIESLLKEMQMKRKNAELECTRIYSNLNISRPAVSESWCPICKAPNCTYSTTTTTTYTPTVVTVSKPVCPICSAENCTYGKNIRCKVCGSEDCSYKKSKDSEVGEKYLVIVEEPVYVPEPVKGCDICGSDNCTYTSTTTTRSCDICFKESCPYFVGSY